MKTEPEVEEESKLNPSNRRLTECYDTPVNKKLKLTEKKSPEQSLLSYKDQAPSVVSSNKQCNPSKGDTDTESEFKVKRTVFKNYKESTKLPKAKKNDNSKWYTNYKF